MKSALSAADKRHGCGHQRHELDVGVGAGQVRHVENSVRNMANVHARFRHFRAIRLNDARGHPLSHLRCRVADIDLTAGDVILAAIERDALGQPRQGVFFVAV